MDVKTAGSLGGKKSSSMLTRQQLIDRAKHMNEVRRIRKEEALKLLLDTKPLK